MRTKTLLITAALCVAAATSWAQVYSVNAVGYVNITVPANGPFALIANPLNGTNNELNTILPLPDDAIGTLIYRWDQAGQVYSASSPLTYLGSAAGWLPNESIPPGEGFFMQALSGSGSSVAITFVGEVPQGNLANPLAGNAKLSFVSSQVPQAAPVGSQDGTGAPVAGTLGFPSVIGDVIYLFDPASGYVGPYTFLDQWYDPLSNPIGNGPTVPVANGFVVQQVGGSATSWTRSFSVNN